MAKNHGKFAYYDVAVPLTNTLLLGYLEEAYKETNTPGSQLLVQLATERVKQICSDGPSASLSGLGPLQAMMASMFSAVPQLQPLGAATNGETTVMSPKPSPAIQSLSYDILQSGAASDDMDSAFGNPD